MRKFFSYGPVDCAEHFCVPRTEFIEKAMEQLIGNPEKSGHYFTVWAPRQTGKTWLMRRVKEEIEKKYGDRFVCGLLDMQEMQNYTEVDFLDELPRLIKKGFGIELKRKPKKLSDFADLFDRKDGIFSKPVILLIDEFDSLSGELIDALVRRFRSMYLNRESYLLHGLALIGVRAVLGVDSERGSPFNIQRSMHVENFTYAEVNDLYQQYIKESGQNIKGEVIDKVFYVTRGHPGLVCWFGELITEKYNPGKDKEIDLSVWKDVYLNAITVEWNNTVLNLIKKAKGKYLNKILSLFERSDILFSLDKDWCNYLYLNGIIDYTDLTENNQKKKVCIFSSTFIQQRLYNAFTYDFMGDDTPIYPLSIEDDLSDVFENGLNLERLITRYRDYLKRLKTKNINPFRNFPKRGDLNIFEAGGHFHLYHWLMNAIGDDCVIIPEFPTGNGRVDLHIRCNSKEGIIEVKSFSRRKRLEHGKIQAATYAKKLGLNKVVLVVFVHGVEEKEAGILKDDRVIDGVRIITEPVVFS